MGISLLLLFSLSQLVKERNAARTYRKPKSQLVVCVKQVHLQVRQIKLNELPELNSRQSGQRAKTGTNKKDHSWHKSLVKVRCVRK